MRIKIKLSDRAKLPVAAHDSDTGYDVIAASAPKIVGKQMGPDFWGSVDYIEYDTGISVAPEVHESFLTCFGVKQSDIVTRYGALDVRPRSSISKYNLVLANPPATIDHEYRGTIKLRFKYLWQPEDMQYDIHGGTIVSYGIINMNKIYQQGDKIGQLVAKWKESIEWEIVENLTETTRGAGGFGSTGA